MFILVVLLLVAMLYATLGHGGASGYLAILLLAGFSSESLRPLVLMMNVVVTSYLLLVTQWSSWKEQAFSPILINGGICFSCIFWWKPAIR